MPVRKGIRLLLAVAALSTVYAGAMACSPVGGPTAGSHSSRSPRHTLTESDLTTVLSAGDVPGFAVSPQKLPLLEAADVVTTNIAACRPIADMMSVRPLHPRKTMVWATMKPEGTPADVATGSLILSSHEEQAARTWMAELKRATTECTRFTAVSRVGWTHRFSVRPVPVAKAGDESVSYLLTNALAPEGKGNVMTVVRTGGVLATYLASQGSGEPTSMSTDVANQLHERVRAAAG
ncbi:hypothetical protein ACIOMM_19885 [Streptomyces sp. NPDC087908]|uniref:hypothetical protein n=1 Tax=Streptomyces sp. NPDC087908 TaxID=3365820 RepID=UPI0037F4ECAB